MKKKCYKVTYKYDPDKPPRGGFYPGYSEEDIHKLISNKTDGFGVITECKVVNEDWDDWFLQMSSDKKGWD